MIVRVLWPYQSYDLGIPGVPVLLNTGVEVTDDQYDDIVAAISDLPAKSRPAIEVGGTVGPPSTDLIPATQGWVKDYVEDLSGGGGDGGIALSAHISNATPHPAYDTDLQDLSTLFENGLV